MKTTIIITARDLDTDERSTLELEAEASGEPAAQRTALVAAVRGVHPGARIRSFADGAATFLDRQHLVVASYSRLPRRSRRSVTEDGQESLFGEAA